MELTSRHETVSRTLVLFYGRAQGRDLGKTIGKAEVMTVLDGLLNQWYASSFEDEPDRDAQFRAYLRAHYEKTIAGLSNDITLSEQVRTNIGL